MALVVRRDGCRMSSDGENIHPFFKLEVHKAISIPPSSEQSDAEPSLQRYISIPQVPLASNEEVVIQDGNSVDDSNSEHEKGHVLNPFQPNSLQAGSDNSQSVCNGGNLGSTSNGLTPIDSKPLRKRRKITKAEPLCEGKQGTLPWHRPSTPTPKDDQTVEETRQTKAQGAAQSTRADVAPSALASQAKPVTNQPIQPSAKKGASEAMTEPVFPAKKIMKLRTDGKLFSPPKKDTSVNSPKRGKKSNSERRKQLVVLRYGNSAESRREIGERIEKILKGELQTKSWNKYPQRIQPTTVKTDASVKVEAHPFFLSQRKSQGHSERLSIRPQSNNNISRSTSPGRPSGKTAQKPPAALLFGTNAAKPTFPSDAKEPLWPPKEMLHVRDIPSITSFTTNPGFMSGASIERKAKESAVCLKAYEEVWDLLRNSVNDPGLAQQVQEDSDTFSLPRRRIVLRSELQALISTQFKIGSHHDSQYMSHQADSSTMSYRCTSPAAQKLFDTLPSVSSAFDAFRCESQEWTIKYAPKSSKEILQPEESMQLLKDWLSGSAVHSTTSHLNTTRARTKGRPGKRRKQTSELDDFIVNSDDDDDKADSLDHRISHEPDMSGFNFDKSAPRHDDGPIRRFTVHTLPQTKAVILSGPHGCGKTAAVHAIAHELGFEIFEINAGTRRSGRDILEKVGDMTKNHLVNQRLADSEDHQESTTEPTLDMGNVRQEIASGKQSTMQSFFKNQVSKVTKDKPRRAHPPPGNKTKPATESNKISKAQRQSLILLEEVDVLFEEDKQFWSTVITLIATSKRPIVMTCNDESLLPAELLEDCSLLNFSHPPKALVMEYLLLMAAHEGHLLTQQSISTLYSQTRLDLRASIVQLNFWCQMAIRDSMGGLNWILFPQDYRDDDIPITERRVMSEGTLLPYMGLLGNNQTSSMITRDEQIQLTYDAALEWGAHTEDLFNKNLEQTPRRAEFSYDDLTLYDHVYDALSAAEALHSAVFSDEMKEDNYFSCASESQQFNNFTINPPVLQNTTEAGMLSCDLNVVISIGYYAQMVMNSLYDQSTSTFDYDHICDSIIHRGKPMSAHQAFIKETMWTALGPLTDCCSQNHQIVANDLAPYIRSIVSYDDRLEHERAHLNKLLSDGTRPGKRQRTTRASRAALEGGHKASTRRERWFECELDFPLVLETGGTDWQDIAWARYQRETRRSKWVQQAECTESEDELCS
ncbi:MAG: hypothetical protein GOMPHAMPRED_005846 [Gomphillus americanus]|uniref:AAA+ ATPase domain-containing protein n=1 Tax=Gomphillus americanus TaxID=1940652 RepID=A0A8H3ITC1_9LECA|nr:MAG: hypothetical protein GOMPHAMPRED_005846 [Gomphillus americanus]